jgi:glycerol uptake facilitator-like aquaporin
LARPSLARRCFAEALATFALVFAGCGAIVLDSERGASLGVTGIAAAFGLVIMAMIYATGHLSGAHINPAVSAAFSVTRHFPPREAAAYVPSQLVGAVAGALLLRVLWDGTPADLGATVPSVGVGSGLVYETVMTGLLMFVIMAVATDARAVGRGRRDRHRRHGRARLAVRRPGDRRLDESCALVRACAGRR